MTGSTGWPPPATSGLPVYYKIGQQLSEADITTLNVAQKNWQGTNYLHYWAARAG